MMFIRPATPADIPALRTLERQADTAAHWAEREYDALFATAAPRRIGLVATGDAGPLGFIIALCGPDEWEIENVVVAPQHRRRGLGRELVTKVIHAAQAASAPAILLEVRQSNLAARQLYAQLGFAESGRRPRYYRDPVEDAVLLRFSPEKV